MRRRDAAASSRPWVGGRAEGPNSAPLFSLLLPVLALMVGGCGNPSFLVTPVYPDDSLREVTVQEPPRDAKGKGGKIAIIELEGVILNAKAGGLLQSRDNPVNRFAESLAMAERDDAVKAVVLRINSPGGGVAASETLYHEVKAFRARTGKPVVASIQDVGASGAYYVACAADEIYAQPSSVVGSVGVIFQTFNVAGTMAKLGVTADAIKSDRNKDAGSPFRPMTPDERAIFQQMIDTFYARFKTVVLEKQKNLPPANQPQAFDGRVMPGTTAQETGLIDHTGLLTDALARARTLAGTPRAKAVLYNLPFSEQGSIYATAPTPPPDAGTWRISLPGISELPPGFYYLWVP